MNIIDYVVLPPQITPFERTYLDRVNRIALGFFAAHVPVFTLIALLNDTKPLLALLLTSFVLIGPFVALRTLKNPRHVSTVMGVTAMAMGGLLVNFGRGAMTIEMHFYFFVLLALLSVFANPMPIVAAAVTAALHHAILWATLPVAVFNYDAPFVAVLVHALFVVIESIAACFVARSFFDNVIGLDLIVQARTSELDGRNREMSVILDNVGQGFLRVDALGTVPRERSKVLNEWLGEPSEGDTFASWIARRDKRCGEWLEVAWESAFDGLLPLDVAIGQLPAHAKIDEREYLLTYRPLLEGETVVSLLVVMSDITAERERERAERNQREILTVFERMVSDRSGFLGFLDEASRLVDAVALAGGKGGRPDTLRALHTLKGNLALFGLSGLATLCHESEAALLESEGDVDLTPIREEWTAFVKRLGNILEARAEDIVEIRRVDYDGLRSAIREGALDTSALLVRLDRYLKEPAQKRLELLGEQAKALAARLGKGSIVVEIEGGDVRLPAKRWASLWAAMVHVVRNAVDHGIETPDERAKTGKEESPRLSLSVHDDKGLIEVVIRDNGRGVNFEKVREQARQQGLPAESDDDLKKALFFDGFSTRSEVTEISGRGVGMSAVLRECEDLGGQVLLETIQGEGTVFRFRIPDRSTYAPLAAE